MKFYIIAIAGFTLLLFSCNDKITKENENANSTLDPEQVIELEKDAEVLEENAKEIKESTEKLDELLKDL